MWHRANPEQLVKLEERLSDAFPELQVVNRGDIIIIKGVYPLVDGGKVIDRYQIELELPRDYPRGIPILRETGGRIPRKSTRHVETDGSACLFVPEEFYHEHPDGMDAIEFLDGPVRGFLVGQSLVEAGEEFPFGERPHSTKGIMEFYAELFNTSDRRVILRYVEVLAAKELRGHWKCPCGSGRRLRDCCKGKLEELRSRIPMTVSRRSLGQLREDA